MDLAWDLQVPQVQDDGTLYSLCNLDPDLFQDDIPKDKEGRTAWTVTQREKTRGCEVLQTPEDLSAWVSRQRLSAVISV